jgi:hypothetical protein
MRQGSKIFTSRCTNWDIGSPFRYPLKKAHSIDSFEADTSSDIMKLTTLYLYLIYLFNILHMTLFLQQISNGKAGSSVRLVWLKTSLMEKQATLVRHPEAHIVEVRRPDVRTGRCNEAESSCKVA